MYFLIIMAFAFVLSEGLPPNACNLFRSAPISGMVLLVAGQLALVALAAWLGRRRALALLDGTAAGHDRAVDSLARSQQVLLGILATALVLTMVCSPWTRALRQGWGALDRETSPASWWLPGRLPLVAEVLILSPLFCSLAIIWSILYGVETRVREAAIAHEFEAAPSHIERHPPHASLAAFLTDKFRHQVLIIAAPMFLIVFAKHFTDRYASVLVRSMSLPWAGDLLLGCASIVVLVFSPLMLRYIWVTAPLPPGPLRDRFERTCRRVGLRYRDILVWNTHGLTLNAAVMGFIPRLRYILVSDALLEVMQEEEVEAVFGHEAGHVRHWHLHYFGLFALVSVFVSGGSLELLHRTGLVTDYSVLNLLAVVVLLLCWLIGFGALSRQFERQADLFGVRCITPDIKVCAVPCGVHGSPNGGDSPPAHGCRADQRTPRGVCRTAANIFGRTLAKIADLNGVPRHATSWRHGSIQSRCDLVERWTSDEPGLRRFDRRQLLIKAGLIVASLTGTAGAAVLYYPQIKQALSGQRRNAFSPTPPPGARRIPVTRPAPAAQDVPR